MTAQLLLIPTEMGILILLIVAVLLFGGSRLAGVGKGAGRAIREFKEETAGLNSKDAEKKTEDGPTDEGTSSAN
ncbi:twin-arginine translocase TatA/TatE family subunit [Acidipropionibacterium timonense]|uniref:twin-arginine translocase TatA/TatE family subunit n=1 Tax=Acidipropionibacterium timonense TaxID=2161818 RepID=UPI00102FB944|nr:twin-arginine translocase TatA/TatE family subunit [Acidipropionibacterium timonense]